jgi:hypothetical protein
MRLPTRPDERPQDNPNYDPDKFWPCFVCKRPVSADPALNICSDCFEAHCEVLAHSCDKSYDPTAWHDTAAECYATMKALYFDWSIRFTDGEQDKKGRWYGYLMWYTLEPRPHGKETNWVEVVSEKWRKP